MVKLGNTQVNRDWISLEQPHQTDPEKVFNAHLILNLPFEMFLKSA